MHRVQTVHRGLEGPEADGGLRGTYVDSMVEHRMRVGDWGFVALATVPMLLAFVIPALLDRSARMPVTYLGVGLSVVFLGVGLYLRRGTLGRRRTWFAVSTVLASLPFVFAVWAIGLQWAVYFIAELLGR